MTKFVCTRCGYRFEAKKADDCPYCGKNSVEAEKSASELISEVEGLIED